MPKKTKEPEILEEPEPEPPVRISKKTGRPVRELTELQKDTLRKGRELALQKRKELSEGVEQTKDYITSRAA